MDRGGSRGWFAFAQFHTLLPPPLLHLLVATGSEVSLAMVKKRKMGWVGGWVGGCGGVLHAARRRAPSCQKKTSKKQNIIVSIKETAKLMEKKGLKTRVVSMPCWKLFEQQPVK